VAPSTEKGQRHSLVVSNVKDMNYYLLTAPDDNVMNEWVNSLKAAIAAVSSEVQEVSAATPEVRGANF
jgi:hypothetical protein